MEREGNPLAEKDEYGNFMHFDFIPVTYTLPSEFNVFVEEFKRHPNSMWIRKPVGGAQGKGITMVNKLDSFKKLDR